MDKAEIETAERAVVADDGRKIELKIYAGADALAAAELDPTAALGIAAKLIDASRRRLVPALKRSCAPARDGLAKRAPAANPED